MSASLPAHDTAATASAEGRPAGFTRRQIAKTAAWSVPAVALAVSVPMASASIAQANFSTRAGSQITVSGANASGTLEGRLEITNVVGSWETGALVGTYRLTGPWETSAVTDGAGAPFQIGQTHGIWTLQSIVQDEYGIWELVFWTPSQTITSDTVIVLPVAAYEGTFGGATPRNPIGALVSYANGGAISSASQSSYPA